MEMETNNGSVKAVLEGVVRVLPAKFAIKYKKQVRAVLLKVIMTRDVLMIAVTMQYQKKMEL